MARINLEQLKTFLTVVRMGSIRKAAVGLNLTQPAVTTRIKSLEESLSVKLFERSSGGLKLTKRGEMLIRYDWLNTSIGGFCHWLGLGANANHDYDYSGSGFDWLLYGNPIYAVNHSAADHSHRCGAGL